MSTALANIETMTGIELFKSGAIDPILAQIEAEAREQAAKLDISTEVNRKALASLSYKLARSKTFFDNTGKELVADKKKEIGAVDAERHRVWDRFEALQEEIRKPLTDWENAEKARVACHEEALNILNGLSLPGLHLVSEIQEAMEKADNLFAHREWEEFKHRATAAHTCTMANLGESLQRARDVEAQRIELERLRAEAAERAIKEREDAAARAAEEAANRRSEEQARIAREAAERERQRIENEAAASEARAKQAEAQRIADAEFAEQKRIAAEKEAARQLELAAERAKREQEAAIEAERARVAAEKKRDAEEAEKRARNRAHQAAINREAKEALIRGTGLDTYGAEAIIALIAKGKIPHVTISY